MQEDIIYVMCQNVVDLFLLSDGIYLSSSSNLAA